MFNCTDPATWNDVKVLPLDEPFWSQRDVANPIFQFTGAMASPYTEASNSIWGMPVRYDMYDSWFLDGLIVGLEPPFSSVPQMLQYAIDLEEAMVNVVAEVSSGTRSVFGMDTAFWLASMTQQTSWIHHDIAYLKVLGHITGDGVFQGHREYAENSYIERVEFETDYEKYFDACDVDTCMYTKRDKLPVSQLVSVILALLGGFASIISVVFQGVYKASRSVMLAVTKDTNQIY